MVAELAIESLLQQTQKKKKGDKSHNDKEFLDDNHDESKED